MGVAEQIGDRLRGVGADQPIVVPVAVRRCCDIATCSRSKTSAQDHGWTGLRELLYRSIRSSWELVAGACRAPAAPEQPGEALREAVAATVASLTELDADVFQTRATGDQIGQEILPKVVKVVAGKAKPEQLARRHVGFMEDGPEIVL